MRQPLLLLLLPLAGNVIDVEEQRRVRRQLQTPLPPRRHHRRRDLGQGAPDQLLKPVLLSTGQKNQQSQNNRARAYPVPPLPSEVVLDVDQDRDGGERAETDEEEEPVEEFVHLVLLLLVGIVELIRPETGDARFDASRSEGDQVERYV